MSGEEKSLAPGAPTPQCQFFVQRKKRLCRMTVKPGRQYCGEHEPQPRTEAGQTDKRIPCPNDPKHTCYASKLLKHLAICNARQTEQPPYIIHNINAPEEVESCQRRPLSAIPKDQLASVIDKVNHLYAKHLDGHITSEPPSPIHRAVLTEFSAVERAESSRRHLRQVSALLWSAERAGLARDRTCYVELGAGKGQLSYYACHAWCGAGSRVLAVDRAPLRHKRDNKLRSDPPPQHTPTPHHTDTAHTDSRIADPKTGQTKDPHSDTDSKVSEPKTPGDTPTDTTKAYSEDSRIEPMDTADNLNPPSDTNNHNLSKSKRISDQTAKASNGDSDRHDPTDTANGSSDSNSGDNRITAIEAKITNNTNRADSEVSNGRSTEQRTSVDNMKGSSTRETVPRDGESDVAVRIRADLAHLALEAVPVVAECNAVVGLAKHLCGVATDYALRCVAAPGLARLTRGAVLATCCHHRVERAAYVANAQLQELGIDAEDFNIMLGIVSWATCGDGRSRERRLQEPPAPPVGATPPGGPPEREETGRRAKALLDWGRVLWLRAQGFDAKLAYYVPREVSLENMVIIATKR